MKKHEKKYLVFSDSEGKAIGRPRYFKHGFEVDGALENSPEGTKFHVWTTKEELLAGDYGLINEDFEEEELPKRNIRQ